MSAARSNPIASVEAPFRRARFHALATEGALSSIEMIRKRHSDVEDMVGAQGREWAWLMLDEHMALRAGLEKRVKVWDAEGVERSSARASERQLTTVVGKVTVPRTAYHESGHEDDPSDGRRPESSTRDVRARHPSDGGEGSRARLVRRGGGEGP